MKTGFLILVFKMWHKWPCILVDHGSRFSQNRFHMICHTSNCCTMWWMEKYRVSVLLKMSYPFTCLAILSRTRYIRFLLDGFHTFSLFISFLLTSFWIVLELLKLLVLYWRFLLILLWFLLLSVAILLDNLWSGILLHSLLL